MRSAKFAFAVLALFLLQKNAVAGDLDIGGDAPVAAPQGPTKSLGLILAMVPDYEGSDDHKTVIGPVLRFKFSGEKYFQVIGNKASLNLLNNRQWAFGPMAVYRAGRDRGSIDDSVVKLMSEVDDSFELGGFVAYRQSFDPNPRHRMNITLGVTQDVSDGHGGLVASFSGDYWRPVSERFDIGLRLATEYASDDYMSSNFDVSTSDSATTGLPTYSAGGGIKDVSFGVMGAYYLNRSWQLGGAVIYKKLLGDAADSPIVDNRGDANQWIAAVNLVYSW